MIVPIYKRNYLAVTFVGALFTVQIMFDLYYYTFLEFPTPVKTANGDFCKL